MDETARCTAHRETWEETGIDVIVGPLVAELSNGFLYDCLAKGLSDEVTPRLRWRSRLEVTRLQWVDISELRPRDWRYRRQLRVIQRILATRARESGTMDSG